MCQISIIADINNDEARDNDMEDIIDEFDIDPNEKVEGEYAFVEEMLNFKIIEKDELTLKILRLNLYIIIILCIFTYSKSYTVLI